MGFRKWFDSDSLEHHGIKGQKWGVRRYQNKDGSRVRREAKDRVEKILSDVQSAADKSGSKLYGLDHKLKTLQSINRKISKKVVEDNVSSEEAAKDIKDAIRFTTITPVNNFVNAYEEFKSNMVNNGYTETRCKNYYTEYKKGNVKHKAVQSTFSTDDGYEFEVQFHTPESQTAKDKKVPLYEEVRTVGISQKRAAELEKQMDKLAKTVPDPPNIDNIITHSIPTEEEYKERKEMSDFAAFSDEIEEGMAYLEHHQILGAKWGVMNGPPYPLGSGDHSSSEKKAAEAAGVKVGSDSGKGSIENVKKKKSGAQNQVKKPKKEMTEEEKREAALKAVRSGDKKKIAKYAEYLTSQELQDADNRVRNLNNIQREEPGVKKASKAEMEKQEAIRSGDKEKVRQYADQMTYQELSEAMNKIDLTQRLNYEPPPKSTMDKISEIANKVDQARQAAEKGIAAYNVAAALYNSTHKGGAQWPIIEKKVNDQKSKEQDVAEKLVKQMSNDMKQNVQQAQQQKQEKSYKEQSKEELRNKKIDYKNQKKYEDWVAKQEKKNKDNDTEEPQQQESQQSNQSKQNSQSNQTNNSPQTETKQRQYTPEQAPQFKKSFFNTKKFENSESKEPTAEQKRLVEEARKSDEQYLNRMRNNNVETVKEVKTHKLSDYNDTPSYDDLIPDSVKSYMNSTPINRSSSNAISREEYNRIKAESEARAKAFTEETNARIEKRQSNARETQAKLDRYDKVRSENAAEEARIKARNEQREKAEANERLNQAREKWQRDIDEAHRESQRISRELFGRELDLPPADKPYWWNDPTQVPKDYR